MLKKLPIGEQNFEEIRKNNRVYVDKTKQILQMIEDGRYYFLSRPRRFGKSLTISTLEAMFQGKAELFNGLYAEDWVKEQAQNPNPVITLDMSCLGDYTNRKELKSALIDYLEEISRINKLSIETQKNTGRFLANIITRLYEKQGQVVVLIDEYDKPITDHIDNFKKVDEIREFLRSFYGILKTYSKYLSFVLITGISKFSKLGIFSGLNNLNDISMNEEYGDIVGYTQKELEDNFSEWLEITAQEKSMDKQKLLNKIERYYDGFSFDGITRVYNPFSVLKFFQEKYFYNYWYNSSTPSFIAKYLKKHKIKEPKEYINQKVTIDFTNASEIETASVESFLYQAGYLTIKKKRGNVIILDYPNEEVRSSMSCLFLDNFYNIKNYAVLSDDIWEALEEENISKIVDIFNQGLKPIPYDDYTNRDESWYRSLFLMVLSVTKITYFAEVHSYQGRSDVVIVFEDKIIVIEFKFAKTSKDVEVKMEEGKNQIKDRDYASPYEGKNKKMITVVFVADDEKRQILSTQPEKL